MASELCFLGVAKPEHKNRAMAALNEKRKQRADRVSRGSKLCAYLANTLFRPRGDNVDHAPRRVIA